MRSVSEVAKLTGVSARTLQYYDEIGLLPPSTLTYANYRLYDDEALQKLQQIIFFKELGFKLQEINEIVNQPNFDKIAAYKKQKELLLLRRNRTDRLIQLLSRLEKGEQCMSFKEFDLTDYINALEDLKKENRETITEHWGKMENFNLLINKAKESEDKIAKRAIRQYGSVEKYTEEMKYNLEHFSEIMDSKMSDEAKKIVQQSDELYAKLTANLAVDCTSDEVQSIAHEINLFMCENCTDSIEDDWWQAVIHAYTTDYCKAITDTKYGSGASDYIVNAFQYYTPFYGSFTSLFCARKERRKI